MKKVLVLMFVLTILAGCAASTPNPAIFQQIVKDTLAAMPTQTACPTYTPNPTYTLVPTNTRVVITKVVTPTKTRTPTLAPTSTDLATPVKFRDENREVFAKDAYDYLNSGKVDCPTVDWSDPKEFVIICLVPGSMYDKDMLLKAAYVITSSIAYDIRWSDPSKFIIPALQLVVTMKSTENNISVTAKTDGETISVPEAFYKYEWWETLAEITID